MSRVKLIRQQQGMVAIITTMILMIVISLIVLGFSQVARRNQRQVLDSQLSSQAFYAAESGLNLAKQKLEANSATAFSDNCADDTGPEYQLDGNNVKITCLLVSHVRDLIFTDVSTSPKVTLIDPAGAGSVGSVFVNWQSAIPSGSIANCTGSSFPANWTCSEPLLRIDMVPLGGSLTQAGLIDNQYTAFLYPDTGSGITSTSWTTSAGPVARNRGSIIKVACTGAISGDKKHNCTLRIDDMVSGSYGIRMTSLYKQSDITIHALGDPELEGSQALADSTARAADVLKRVQARIRLTSSVDVPSFAIDSGTALCKAYEVAAGLATYTNPDCAL